MYTAPESHASAVPFDRTFFDPAQRFKFIGAGQFGGKAAGLASAQDILGRRFDRRAFPRLDVSIPSLTVLTTEVFEEFVQRNRLDDFLDRAEPDEAIARAVQYAGLPVSVLGDLRALVEQVRTPLAVRSSSMLEDALTMPFAGVYRTKMIPNNQPSPDERFRRLAEAIRFVYASVYFAAPRAILEAIGSGRRRDSMAVIIQEVVGTRFRDRYYPQVSGVARSFNYYPTGHARREDGVINLALGLGKTIVDGGVCWTYSPAWPNAPAPFASPAEISAKTQTLFWAVNMGRPPEYDPIRETEYLLHEPLQSAEEDGTLSRLASTFDPHTGQIRMGTGTAGPRVLDFSMLLTLREPPLNDAAVSLLHLFEDEMKTPVELELAATFSPDRLGFLQVRPMVVPATTVSIADEELRSPRNVVASSRVLGNGVTPGIHDILYVKLTTGRRLDTAAIAEELSRLNQQLTRQGRRYLLIGFGRWGSSDPSLGIPVEWAHVSGAAAIVETMAPELDVEPSQASHFFHNLSAQGMAWFSIPSGRGGAIDWEWLAGLPAEEETPNVRHAVSGVPLEIRVDGRSGRGVVVRGPESEGR